jgi:hypothetical protein
MLRQDWLKDRQSQSYGVDILITSTHYFCVGDMMHPLDSTFVTEDDIAKWYTVAVRVDEGNKSTGVQKTTVTTKPVPQLLMPNVQSISDCYMVISCDWLSY